MAFRPKAADSPAPRGFRRFIHKSEHEFSHSVSLVRRDYSGVSSEQLLNVLVELYRRGSRNQLDSVLMYLMEMNGEVFAGEPEDRIE